MENDMYRRVIRELSNKSERDLGFRRVEEEKNKIAQFVKKGVFLLLQLAILIATSSFFAVRYSETSIRIINLYVVALIVAILGVLNYSSLWKKFTRKYIVVILILVSVLVTLRIFLPAKLIPQNSIQLPFFVWWGIIVTVISVVIYVASNTLVNLVEQLLDLATVFLPILPATFGASLPDLTSKAYEILYKEMAEKDTRENDLRYLISASQADVDSAGIRSLPWVVILGFGAANFSEILKGNISVFSSVSSFLGFLLLLIGLLAIFSMARMTYFQTLIIQVANRLLIDIPKTEPKPQENLNRLVVLTENNKPSCLWRILFP